MAVLRLRSTVWEAPARQDLLRYLSATLLLGQPATYLITPPPQGQEWKIFSSNLFTLEHFAKLGALMGIGLGQLPQDWTPPTIMGEDEDGNPIDTGVVDREAAVAEIDAVIAAENPVVLPESIDYEETVTIQVPDRELRTWTDPETGEEHEYWFDLGTTHPEDVVQGVENVWQHTLDAQTGVPATIKGEPSPDPEWEAVTDGG